MIIEVTIKTNSKKGPLLEKIPPATGNYALHSSPTQSPPHPNPKSPQPIPLPSPAKTPPPTYQAYLREKPHDNAANTALLKLLSKTFHVPKTQIKILSGQKSHHKKIALPDPPQP